MAEVKNSFIKSKMNKDLDARLIPNGEYREGNNIQVSKSDGADVGALENVLGNLEIADFKTQSGCGCDLTAIGMYTDGISDRIFVFLTDYDETVNGNSQLLNYSLTANNYIYLYNTSNSEITMLLSGAYLNFSKNKPIFGVNLLENMLFWTDNRNQPRRINVSNTLSQGPSGVSPNAQVANGYYTTEDQISATTYAPYQSIELYYKKTAIFNTNGGTANTLSDTPIGNTTIELNSASVGQGSSITPRLLIGAIVSCPNVPADTKVVGYVGNVLTIDKQTISAIIPAGTVVIFNKNTLQGNDQYVTSMLNVSSLNNPDGSINSNYNANYNGDPDFLEDRFVRFSYRFRFESGEYSLMAPFTQAVFIPKQDGYFLNPNSAVDGDTKDEQSAYRSTIVDFMENKVNNIFLQIPTPALDDANGNPTSNGIPGNLLYNALKISEIEILYKESNGISIKVVDSIPRDTVIGYEQLSEVNGVYTDTIIYNYQSTKPYKTLPSSEIVRVYDKSPVRALGQEVIGNRIVYSNFQNKHTPPLTLNYNVAVSNKITDFVVNEPGSPQLKPLEKTVSREYPTHTVKQNRNYQVGVILSDKYGRSSTTILSSANTQALQSDGTVLVGDTVYFPYNVIDTTTSSGDTLNTINSWPGDSIKILFNTIIPNNLANTSNLEPGIYNGNSTSSSYNPLGWYSYKIVVKQQEQEYYNVYLPGILNPYPNGVSVLEDPVGTVNTITLINDNINKIPRDLTEVGPEQKQFRSSVQLYGRVTPNASGEPSFNKQFNPSSVTNVVPTTSTVASIGEQNTLLGLPNSDFIDIYQSKSNPLLARATQDENNQIGALGATASTYNILLGVYETTPSESVIDIYYETSSSGTIHQLNEAINEIGTGIAGFTTIQGAAAPNEWSFNLYENIAPGQSPNQTYSGSYAVTPNQMFFPYTQDSTGSKTTVQKSEIKGAINAGDPAPVTQDGMQVFNGNNEDVSNSFLLITDRSSTPFSYYVIIRNNTYFYYGPDSNAIDAFRFVFTVKNLEPALPEDQISAVIDQYGKLLNNKPIIEGCSTPVTITHGEPNIKKLEGFNGSADVNRNRSDLQWTIEQSPEASKNNKIPEIEIDEEGQITETTLSVTTTIKVTVRLYDSGTDTTTYSAPERYAECIMELNGNAGYDTVPVNADVGAFKNMLINSGAESSWFGWTSPGATAISAISAGTAPTTLAPGGTPVNDGGGASGLIGNGYYRIITDAAGIEQNGTEACATRSWKWYNTVRNNQMELSTYRNSIELQAVNFRQDYAKSDISGSGPVNEGTLYIIIDFNLINYNVITGDQPSVVWPTYLQYRQNTNVEFSDAIDIEGNTIQFGSTQDNSYIISSIENSAFTDSGILNNKEESLIGLEPNQSELEFESARKVDSFQTILSPITENKTYTLNTVGRRLVAVGTNSAYPGGPENKLGEYRLLVRFPFGDNIPVDNNEKVIPTLTVTACPNGANTTYTSNNNRSNQQVYLNYGNFYQPDLLNNTFNASTLTTRPEDIAAAPSSFEYRISDGYDTRKQAEAQTPQHTVFAREWGMRYISQLFINEALETAYGGTVNNKFYSYTAVSIIEGEKEKSIAVLWGSDNASPNESKKNPTETQFSRKWTAQFNGSSKKILKTSQPCEFQGTPNSIPGSSIQYGNMSFTIIPTDQAITITLEGDGEALMSALVATPNKGGASALITETQSLLELFLGESPNNTVLNIPINSNTSQARWYTEDEIQYIDITGVNLAGASVGDEYSNYYWTGT